MTKRRGAWGFKGPGFRVKGLGFEVYGLGFREEVLGGFEWFGV